MTTFTDIQLYIIIFCIITIVIVVLCYIYYLRSRLDTMEQILNCIKCNNYSVRTSSKWTGFFKDDREKTINNVLNYLNERYLQQQEQLLYLNNLLDNVDSALIVADEYGNVNWCNRAVQHPLLGYAPNKLSQLESLSPELPKQLVQLHPGEVKSLRFERNGKTYEMAATMTRYLSRNQTLTIFNLRNIHQLLMKNEQQANHQLMRVLTHEMMNSLTPIISLSDMLKETILQPECDLHKIREGIEVIRRRSDGLLRFVNNYRQLAKLAPPVLQSFSPYHLLENIRPLTYSFRAKISFPPTPQNANTLRIQIDPVQIEQVILNLLKNADEACQQTSHPLININIEISKKQVQLHIQDNGAGISPTAIKHIFVPFYTTKQHGCGIGLALCRQIMSGHQGNITLKSTLGEGTCFTLLFPREDI